MWVKRVFDIFVATFFLAILAPVYAVIALLVKMDSKGPVHFVAKRVGKNGKLFDLYKFRTMVKNAPEKGPGITAAKDPRVTRVGNFLRRMKLDEVPQLWNVLSGNMGVIGPRPEDPRYLPWYTEEQKRVFSIRPGMASRAFLKYRHEEAILARAKGNVEEYYTKVILPDKLKLDLDYIDNWSFKSDLRIFMEGMRLLFRFHPEETTRPRRPHTGPASHTPR
jgi:lipopolysaccharide/colanic/teichoic acid biosynthesis glycosyltransferase